MAIIKCKMCGGDIELNEEKTFGTCEYCGSVMTLPKVSDDQRAARFNRGNHFRRQGDFDKALAVYESIVREDDTDAEAHWCCALCRFGIEYVEDPNTYEFIPTCHRASFDSFTEDVDYLAALENSDDITRRQYQKDAAKIAEVQRGILATSQNEEPYDVFICYKETDDSTKERTRDSLDAQEIYYQLTQEGYRVFFSRITLEDKVGAEYEPYIFAALNSAKVMVAIGSKPEYFNAVWVKNEWSRFLAMMRKDRSKLLLPCYKGMDPYDLPEQLGVLQSYDMAKIGFMQDLIRGIKKVLKKDEPKEMVKEKVVVQQTANTNIAPLLKRVFMYLEDGDWKSADEYAERVLDQDPENAEAYVGKLMAELHVHCREDLANQEEPFDDNKDFKKAVRFGDDKLTVELNGYIAYIIERNKNEIYDRGVNAMNTARSEIMYKEAAKIFYSIPGWKDADKLAEQCHEKADEQRMNTIQMEEKAKIIAPKVARAIKEGSQNKTDSTLEEKLASVKARIGYLERIIIVIDEKQSQIAVLKKEIDEIILHEKRLYEQRSKLGAFSGKEKKRINEELDAFLQKKDYLSSIIAQFYKELGSYATKEDVEQNLKEARKSAAYLETQIERAHEAAGKECSYLEALNAYLSEPGVTRAVNTILYPTIAKDSIVFGRYDQEKSGTKEPIEWQVLTRENRRMLVISKYALDYQQYNTSNTGVTWENCSLRKWLNGSFFSSAFNLDEQNIIANSIVIADENSEFDTPAGNDTVDKIFLLSITEVNKYFNSDEARICEPTTFALAQFTDNRSKTEEIFACVWWLRTSGLDSNFATKVFALGNIDDEGNYVTDKLWVRPVLWLNLESKVTDIEAKK